MWQKAEQPKANGDIPDQLGVGEFERRSESGELLVYFKGSNVTKGASWVVLGKFAHPRDDGKQFYVSDRIGKNWSDKPNVTYHEDLLMAVSWIVELKDQWDKSRMQGE
jgi:hypothetical protein